MFKKRELLIILILAVLVSALAGYISEFPLPNTWSTPCFLEACPLRFNLVNILLNFLFWFMVLAAGWWGIKRLKIKEQR